MTWIHRHRPVAAALAALALLSGVVGSSTMALAQGDVEPRERSFEPRVRSYTIRSESIDGAERDEQSADERRVTLDADLLFEFDEDTLNAEAEGRLDDLAEELDELGPREVTIAGHTDNQGAVDYNQDLSERRAESVHTALADSLGDDFEFDVAGYGQDEPVADNETEEGQALNRRVEIQFSTG